MRQAWGEPIKGKRSRGRQLKRWKDILRERLEELGLKEKDVQGKQKCKRGIKATDLQLARGQSVGEEEVCAKISLEFLQ